MSKANSRVWAVSDLHVGFEANANVVRNLGSGNPDDWLIVAGDVGDTVEVIEWTLRELRSRFDTVIWVPGNHDLWCLDRDPVQAQGEARYRILVDMCRQLDVITPEDPYPVWTGPGGPVQIVPLFLLYDYSFRHAGQSKEQALDDAFESGFVLSDERLLSPSPHPSREAWCAARVASALERLRKASSGPPMVLVNHWPLHERLTDTLRHAEVALWCGTRLTHTWHQDFDVAAVVFGHLHIPGTTIIDGVRFEEVSLGYPSEWTSSWHPHATTVTEESPDFLLRQILPARSD